MSNTVKFIAPFQDKCLLNFNWLDIISLPQSLWNFTIKNVMYYIMYVYLSTTEPNPNDFKTIAVNVY